VLERYGATATLFMVGHDFLQPANVDPIRAVAAQGHEIANHSMHHPQGFRFLSDSEMDAEIGGMEQACQSVTGKTPVGFRSPGWNIGDRALPILRRRGYLYDSSIHPTSLMPLFKALHWWNTRNRTSVDRTTMGQISYMFSPRHPYRTSDQSLSTPGAGGIVELPVTVVPIVRMPFWATFLLASGIGAFKASLRALVATRTPVQFQFHLSDFVDFNDREFRDQVPRAGDGVYVPQALWTPLKVKHDLFTRALDLLAEHYEFVTLERWASRLPQA